MFAFVSGNLALDFAGTVKARATTFDDFLTTPADLDEWLLAADLLDTTPHCDATTLDQAVRLREAGYRLALAAARDEPFADADRKIVNELAGGQLPRLTLRSDATITRHGDPDAALAAIARSAIEMLGGPERGLIKECGRDECTRLYLDTSRGKSRRWCDMTICGNRAKSAAFRARHVD
ncbi:CGNR zinc finger domain-containing protein [Nocardia vinacea]|uniref:CGNR zinc finger domain-containing protein n=1 Tax=Nocardia vinacea TaxID=96468 RepID=A0ABZ1Z867_9NOCA|nr:CGNR zinc finger domain-containing protein [Nocardia vinacea]